MAVRVLFECIPTNVVNFFYFKLMLDVNSCNWSWIYESNLLSTIS